jgi:hypothetical protein
MARGAAQPGRGLGRRDGDFGSAQMMHVNGYMVMVLGVILTLALAGGFVLLLMRRNRNNQNQK